MQEKLNILAARAVYSSDSALMIFENKYWKEFFNALRPAWKPPTAYQLGTPLLQAEYENIEKKVFNTLKNAKALGLQCDGWSNKR